jgi:hypothetical protein
MKEPLKILLRNWEAVVDQIPAHEQRRDEYSDTIEHLKETRDELESGIIRLWGKRALEQRKAERGL